ncbi:MAG: fructosamine kinase family protein [Chitinophagaceae bacterium]
MQPSIAIQNTLKQKLNTNRVLFQPISGGSINETYRLIAGDYKFFCKLNSVEVFPQLFRRELKGLEAIGKTRTIKVPAIIDCFEIETQQVLLMEWINEGERTKPFWKNFGVSLAALHGVTNEQYGYEEDNYMGSVNQINKWNVDWNVFFIEQRLKPLVEKCITQSLITAKHHTAFEELYKRLPTFFEDQKPGLLHGDLWGGNFMCNEKSEPVLIDPAVYYGHRSVDLAMTSLFGGFHSLFYEAYQYHHAFPDNYLVQWKVCNLYPLLIHLFLFGKTYLPKIERTLNELG